MTKIQLYKLVIYYLWNSMLSMIESLIIALPLGIVLGFLAKLFVNKYCKKKEYLLSKRKKSSIILFVIYISVMLQMAILYRTFGEVRQIDLIPFNTPGGVPHIILYALANAIIFLPVGILPPMIWKKMDNLKSIALAGFCGSLFIELAQLILQCGVVQTEDLIMNTVGAGVGYWIYKKYTKSEKQRGKDNE